MYKKEVFASMVLKECERCILYGPGGKILMKGRVEVAGESKLSAKKGSLGRQM